MRRVLITGASGFIGANFFHHLRKRKASIFLLDKKFTWRLRQSTLKQAAQVIEIDLRKSQAVRDVVRNVRPTHVFHFASAGVSSPKDSGRTIVSTNALSSLALLQSLKNTPPKIFVNIGSCFEYGSHPTSIDESTAVAPLTVYSASKVASTYLTEAFGRSFSIPVVTLRLFGLFGPYDAPQRLVAYSILSILNNKPSITMTQGSQVLDYMYIEDLMGVFDTIMRHPSLIPPYEIINIGSGRGITIKEVVEMIRSLMDSDIPLSPAIPTRRFEYQRQVADISKARKLLGWAPTFGLKHGLLRTIRWFKKNLHLYDSLLSDPD